MEHLIRGLILGAVLLTNPVAWAAHPLITDDAGTQGKGKYQIEINGQYDSDKETENGVALESRGGEVATCLSYGALEYVDLVLNLPYQWGNDKEAGDTVSNEDGIADPTFEVKWRFFEKGGLSLALKPGVSFPTGNDERGLGTGKSGYHAFVIASQEAMPWAFHINLGYIGNENRIDEEKNLWHASFATAYEVINKLKIVGNVGVERNTDMMAANDPAFLLGGVIYSLSDDSDIDCGVKYGLSSSETDWSLMAGTAFRF